jgi:hypothetical protein
MRRTTGFLLGCLLMLGVFALVLTGSHTPPGPQPPKAAISRALETESLQPVEPVVPTVVSAPAENENDTGDAPMATASSSPPGSRHLDLNPQTWNQATEYYAAIEHRETAGQSRQALWTPFRSQWAAQGFARRLALATEVPVEVVSESPGVYQVVFRYHDDAERRAHLQRIETITGLELEP